MCVCVGLFLRWTDHTQTMDEAREEIRTLVKEHRREKISSDDAIHTLLTHRDAFTVLENDMDELTIL